MTDNTLDDYNLPKMDVQEFIDEGYLQEANRMFFHPLGLALGVEVDSNRMIVLDYRDDPEGVVFDEVNIDKANRIMHEWQKRIKVRRKTLGFALQPKFHTHNSKD